MYLLNTFGDLTLVRAATREMVGAPRRKPLALLALVAASGERGAERDWLATMLWPDVDDVHARRALSQTVYSLRRELGAEVLQGAPRLTIDPSLLTTDAAEFAASAGPGRSRDDLERAAALYAGPYLDGVQFPGCAEFDHWAARERAVHAAAYQGVLAELARLAANAAGRSTTSASEPPNPGRQQHARAGALRFHSEKSSGDRWRYVAGAVGSAVVILVAAWLFRPGSANGALDSLPAAFSAEVARPARIGAGGEMLLDVRAVSLRLDSAAPTALTQYVDDVLRKRLAASATLVPIERVRALRDSLLRARGERAWLGYTGWEILEGSRAPLALEVSVVYDVPRSDSVSMLLSLYRKAVVPPCPEEWRHFASKTDSGGVVDGFESWSSFRVKAPVRAPTRYVDSLVRSAARMVESMRTCDLEAHRGVTTSPWCWVEPNRVGVVPGVVRARIAAGEDIHMAMMSSRRPKGPSRFCSYSSREAFGN